MKGLNSTAIPFHHLKAAFEGEFYTDNTSTILYATDASAYREIPLAVAIPKTNSDIKNLITFAGKYHIPIIPRTAGTSLAGQVVGKGIVVDVSKNFNKILEVNPKEGWVRVQPGVIRDVLNMQLAEYGIYFAPETSTANRAMIGGMIGNNSCGANSVVHGSTRDHLLEVKGYLSDGSEVTFKALTHEEFETKIHSNHTLENEIYSRVYNLLKQEEVRREIQKEFPKASIHRRNTGYAIDILAQMAPFTPNGELFNMAKLVAGSEGTLMFITEAKLKLTRLPPEHKALVCVHFTSVIESLRANLIALKHHPTAVELMDHYVLECTKTNIEQRENRFFVEGDPQAILIIELIDESREALEKRIAQVICDLKAADYGYHYPVVWGDDIKKVWTLRKAGLGLLSNIPGDAKPVPVIEDTAVDVHDLPVFIEEFNAILKKYDLYCVHYAHAGSGELHLRPIINLKTKEGNKLFRTIADEIARLVKKYHGSLSGEHGDGRLRGEFIPSMIGERNYELLKAVKRAWDPQNIFNPGKIVDTPSMNESLRYQPGQVTPQFDTVFDFTKEQGLVRAAELCNGSGDCRKSHLSGGTMCPSYMATKNEKDTTRARANILREILTNSTKENPFDSKEIKEVMDLCLSCKGCKAECPSNVDVGKLKAEWQHQYHQANGIPLRTQLVANFTRLNNLASKIPWLYNFSTQTPRVSGFTKSVMGFAQKRSMPKLYSQTFRSWFRGVQEKQHHFERQVMLFVDEFTNYNDVGIGRAAVNLLNGLGYGVSLADCDESGRTYLSKGLLDKARSVAQKNIQQVKGTVSNVVPLIGIEPSAILTFRDEYIDLLRGRIKEEALKVSNNTFLIEEFLVQEFDRGNIKRKQFTEEGRKIKLHGHCHQKALSALVPTKKILSLPRNYTVEMIPSGCCGMAGSFGYEKEHYEVSMKIGELVLFPSVRNLPSETIIAAPGTSCRHQIKDGTGKLAQHPVEILFAALH